VQPGPELPAENVSAGLIEDESEDELTLGGRRLPDTLTIFGRRVPTATLRTAAWRAVAVAGVIALSVTLFHSTNQKSVHTPAAAPPSSAAPITSPTDGLSPFDRVLALAHQQLRGEIRQTSPPGSCAPVRVGHPPETAIRAVVNTLVIGAPTVVVSARTLDQFTGLCAVQLRATTLGGGVIIVVQISAPPPHPQHNTLDAVEVGVETDAGVTTKYALQTRHDGWIILVGATGSSSAVPNTRELGDAAATPSMVW